MARRIILVMSAKGTKECTGQSRTLSPELRNLLFKIDDRSTTEEILRRDVGGSTHHLAAQLERLKAESFVLERDAGVPAGRILPADDEDCASLEAIVANSLADEPDPSARLPARGPAPSMPMPVASSAGQTSAMRPMRSQAGVGDDSIRRAVTSLTDRPPAVAIPTTEPAQSIPPSVAPNPAPVRSPGSRTHDGVAASRGSPAEEAVEREELPARQADRVIHHGRTASGNGGHASIERSREPGRRTGNNASVRPPSIASRFFNRVRRLSVLTLLLGAAFLVGGLCGSAFFALYSPDLPRLEAALSAQIGESVSIGGADLDVWPTPALVLRDVAIGGEARFKARAVRAVLNPSALLGGSVRVSRVEVQNAVIASEFFWTRSNGSIKPVAAPLFDRIDFVELTIVDPHWTFGPLSASATTAKSGQLQRMHLVQRGGSITMTFPADGTEKTVVSLNVGLFHPESTSMTINNLVADGTLTRDEFVIKEFKGQAAGGSLRGDARMQAGQRWSLEGTVEARGVDLALVAPALFQASKASGKARFSMSAESLDKLFAKTTCTATRMPDDLLVRCRARY